MIKYIQAQDRTGYALLLIIMFSSGFLISQTLQAVIQLETHEALHALLRRGAETCEMHEHYTFINLDADNQMATCTNGVLQVQVTLLPERIDPSPPKTLLDPDARH